MSYEKGNWSLRVASKNIIHSYGAPLGMLLFILLAALYVFTGGRSGPAAGFPRVRGEFVEPSKAERRIEELATLLEENPGDIRALDESGRLKFQLGQPRYVEAIADLEKARALGLADPRSFYYLGVMYQAVGLYDFAAQEYRRFLNNFPEDIEVRMLLAKLYYASGDFTAAVREYEALIRDGQEDPVLSENLALARWKSGLDYSTALEGLRARGPSGAFLADYAEGRIKYDEKDYKGALPLLQAAAEAAPASGTFADHAALFWMAGDAANRNKDLRSASIYLKELQKVSPGHEEGARLLAKVERALAAEARAAEKAAKAAAAKAAKADSSAKKK